MSIIIKKENGMFNMYQNEELIHENLKVIVDKRKGDGITDGDIRLPANSLGKTWLSTTKFRDGITEIDLANIPSRAPSAGSAPKAPKENWIDYLTDEEKVTYEELKKNAEERMTKKQATNQFLEMAKKFTREELMAMLAMNGEG